MTPATLFTEPHSKSVAALYSPDGDTTATYVYSPYGDTTIESGGAVATDNPFRYISGFQDTAGAEDYYKRGARYYDGHGHFTQPDPVAGKVSDPRTMTAYNYAAGDPINQFDPSGRWFKNFVKGLSYLGTGVTAYRFSRAIFRGDSDRAWAIAWGTVVGGASTAGCGLLIGVETVGVGLVACAVWGGQMGSSAEAHQYNRMVGRPWWYGT